MLEFRCKPEIYKFKTFQKFIEDIKVTKNDLVITIEFIYNKYFHNSNIECNYVIQDHYGVGEPTDSMVKGILSECENYDYNRVIAIGGGTVIDISKLLVLEGLKSSTDLYKMFISRDGIKKNKELLIVPTTCGTGSEVTNITIVSFEEKNIKLGLAIDELFSDKAIIVQELLQSLPYYTFITSSIDALIHAIESFLSPKSNSYTELYSEKAMKVILQGYLQIINEGEDIIPKIIDDITLASNFAGIAFSNTGVGAIHAISYPLSGKYHVLHGEANYIFLTAVLKKYYLLKCNGKIKELNKIIRESINSKMDGLKLYDEVDSILGALLPRKNLNSLGMKKWESKEFAKIVIKSQQRLLQNNYVPLCEDEIELIYKELM